MKKIFKYQLELADENILEMPEGAHILSAQIQNGRPCIWALVDPERAPESRIIRMIGTGHPIPKEEALDLMHLGTFQLEGGAFVGHIFERQDIPF